MKITKSILINNLTRLEEYLELNPYYDETWLHSLELRENTDVKGVQELLDKIPAALDQTSLQQFYEETGLHILVEHHDHEYSFTREDRKGKYPREFLNLFSPDKEVIFQQLKEHPEWLDPQDTADLIVRYVSEIVEEPKQNIYNIHVTVTTEQTRRPAPSGWRYPSRRTAS